MQQAQQMKRLEITCCRDRCGKKYLEEKIDMVKYLIIIVTVNARMILQSNA
jgi:hypothetical protein